jgi:NADH-quinone oxidoreductase subunit C
MTPEEICEILKKRFPEAVAEVMSTGSHPQAVIHPAGWLEVAAFLRDDREMHFDLLRCISAIDLLASDKLACVYDLASLSPVSATEVMVIRQEFAVRVYADRRDPHIPSVAGIWPAADWHEREAFDMMGIIFDSHPDLKRILCPDDWEGYPLRKDYEFPAKYHDIPGTTEHELPNPRH